MFKNYICTTAAHIPLLSYQLIFWKLNLVRIYQKWAKIWKMFWFSSPSNLSKLQILKVIWIHQLPNRYNLDVGKNQNKWEKRILRIFKLLTELMSMEVYDMGERPWRNLPGQLYSHIEVKYMTTSFNSAAPHVHMYTTNSDFRDTLLTIEPWTYIVSSYLNPVAAIFLIRLETKKPRLKSNYS